jgi:hypothetical protein
MSLNFKRFIVIVVREMFIKENNYTKFTASAFVDGSYYSNIVKDNGGNSNHMVEVVIDALSGRSVIPERTKGEITSESAYGYCKRTDSMIHCERVKVSRLKDLNDVPDGWSFGTWNY